MDVDVTLPTVDDVRGIQEVFYKTWLATYPNEKAGITVEDIEERFSDAFTAKSFQKRKNAIIHPQENFRMLVVKKDTKVVGVCCLVKREDFNQLQAIYVLPEYQGGGIGYKLWEEGIKFFDDKKDIVVHVAEYNKNAINFYTKLGFIDNGKRFTDNRHKMKSGALIPEIEMVFNRK